LRAVLAQQPAPNRHTRPRPQGCFQKQPRTAVGADGVVAGWRLGGCVSGWRLGGAWVGAGWGPGGGRLGSGWGGVHANGLQGCSQHGASRLLLAAGGFQRNLTRRILIPAHGGAALARPLQPPLLQDDGQRLPAGDLHPILGPAAGGGVGVGGGGLLGEGRWVKGAASPGELGRQHCPARRVRISCCPQRCGCCELRVLAAHRAGGATHKPYTALASFSTDSFLVMAYTHPYNRGQASATGQGAPAAARRSKQATPAALPWSSLRGCESGAAARCAPQKLPPPQHAAPPPLRSAPGSPGQPPRTGS